MKKTRRKLWGGVMDEARGGIGNDAKMINAEK